VQKVKPPILSGHHQLKSLSGLGRAVDLLLSNQKAIRHVHYRD
jgi:hypothetical protein